MEKNQKEKKELNTTAELTSFAFDIGYSIAIPIIILVALGRFADKHFNTAPWLMITGLILSIITTSIIVYRKTKDLL